MTFEDGETAEAEFPSDDAKILLSPNVLQEAVQSAGQGRIISSLAAVLKKKTLPTDVSNVAENLTDRHLQRCRRMLSPSRPYPGRQSHIQERGKCSE